MMKGGGIAQSFHLIKRGAGWGERDQNVYPVSRRGGGVGNGA